MAHRHPARHRAGVSLGLGASTAAYALDWYVADRTGLRAEPSRTCVGCRRSDSWSALLRVVADQTEDGRPTRGATILLPDPRRRKPGRGAWVHPTPECFELAVRRKAFGRALHLQGPVDLRPVAQHLGIRHS
ncbi:MAG: YlxR family protein [Intrasporangium sp.]|uniref:YlxR family protein n=1 Tax=Intrasporangium sp. TaxID=1925024 RepID=UPI002649651C|nr:YlxR family protein [Intrasporangium sp.]MDN5794206.1 YlxR family protein [Intrasporangium sp.]